MPYNLRSRYVSDRPVRENGDSTTQRVRKSEVQDPNIPNCSICRDDIGVTSQAMPSSCLHVFHVDCIEEWIRTSGQNSCPLCRRNYSKLFLGFKADGGDVERNVQARALVVILIIVTSSLSIVARSINSSLVIRTSTPMQLIKLEGEQRRHVAELPGGWNRIEDYDETHRIQDEQGVLHPISGIVANSWAEANET